LIVVALFLFIQLSWDGLKAQVHYTPYDELPTLIKNYKPAFNENYPDWAKMLYQYPVNFKQINQEYQAYKLEHQKEKSAIIRYYKLWRRAVSPYVQNDGSIKLPDISHLQNALHQEQLRATPHQLKSTTSNANWTFLGPKETFWLNESGASSAPGACPWQVNVYSLDIAPSDNNTIYCGTETGYVNKSTDNGITWQLMAPHYPFGGGVTATAIHPTDPNTVYVAAGKQIHKTIDGGTSWTPLLAPTQLFHADRLRINPDQPQILAAASGDGVFMSFNQGATWEKKWNNAAYDVEFKPDDSQAIFAIIKKSTGNYGIIQSTNGGSDFSEITSFPSNIAEGSGGLLATTPDSPQSLFVVMLSSKNDNTPYLYKGTLSGTSWTWNLLATGKTSELEMNNGQGYFDLVLEVSPSDANLIFVGTTTLFKSTNGGASFGVIGGYWGDFPIHPDIQDMKILPSGNTWVATDGGLNYSTDYFTNTSNHHVRISNLIGSDMWGFDQGWNEDIVVGGRYHNGNTAIADFYGDKALRMGGAESPTGWVLQGKSRHVAFNDLGNGWILPQTAESKPEGRFIFSKYPNMDEYGGRRSNLLHHPNYYDVLYLGEGNGFWQSQDGGLTYDLLHTFPDRVRYLQISYSNPSVIYADVVNYGLYRSSNGGKSWTSKSSLTNGMNGTSYWKGKLFFAISPYNEDVLYACLQNGTWTADIGKIFKSINGGDSWTNWTGSINGYTKNLVIQPTSAGEDLVYLLTTSKNGKTAKVYYRKESDTNWTDFSNNYPAGKSVNLALPFFRDSKLRVGGSGGVWESPLQETTFEPMVNPWCQKPNFNCMLDTVYFDDHSILNHEGASWQWSFDPEPSYVDDPTKRNPKVVFGNPGNYEVSLSVTKGDQTYTKTIPSMVTLTTCPSIDDCSNPAELPKENWTLMYADSEELYYQRYATNAFDGKPETFWHTAWSSGSPGYPHEIQIDLGTEYEIHSFTYLPRQDGQNGRIKNYELYLSNDQDNWGTAIKKGSFENSAAPQSFTLTPHKARYARLKALSEVNGNAWTSIAELTITGCIKPNSSIYDTYSDDISAYPIPTNGQLNLSLLSSDGYRSLQYTLFSVNGQAVKSGRVEGFANELQIDLSAFSVGIYYLHLTDQNGTRYRLKVIKK
jgi:hypothetical protein